tara:strand:+ start:839 stop:1249 length:411 start_codon:yes stop_codon:yes gene_type:complete
MSGGLSSAGFFLREIKTIMTIKSSIAALAAAPLLASGAAFAGPYVNVEVNSAFTGSDYTSTATDIAIGWEGNNWFVQGGPIISATDGGSSSTDFLGKAGGNVALNESVGLYGELAVQTADGADNAYGVKLGTKYTF